MPKEIKTLSALEATRIIKSLGIALMSRKLKQVKMKCPTKQAFCDQFAGLNYVYYVFNLDDKTVRQGNFFDINGQSKFRYYEGPAESYDI